MRITIPKEIQQIIELINNHGYEAYLVGGAVRDRILGIDNQDYDLCTNMPLEEIKTIIPFFNIMRENDHRNTGIFRINDNEIEISSFHGDSLEEDLSNRDLTMNAIACDKDGNIIDPYNGVKDINNRTISLVKKDGEAIDIDPLRILRILRFKALYNFNIDTNTKTVILSKKELLNNVAVERIYQEFKKILLSNHPSIIIDDYKDIFCILIPELKESIGFKQNNPHHLYDVFNHTLKVIDNTPNNLALRMSALFHDLGKPACYKEDEKGIGHFLGHQFISAKIFENFANKYKIDSKTKDLVTKLVICHDQELSTKPVKVTRFLQKFGVEHIELLFKLKEADKKGQNYANEELEYLNKIKQLYLQRSEEEICLTIKDLKINGRKLLEMGFFDKKIGIILRDVLEQVTNEQLVNEEEQIVSFVERKYK